MRLGLLFLMMYTYINSNLESLRKLSTQVLRSWCSPWCQPSLKYFYPPPLPPFKGPPLIRNICLSLLHLFWNRSPSLFLDLLISFIKPSKMSDFSKLVSHVITIWYYNWKHSETYYNKGYYMYKSLWTSYVGVNPVKWKT